MKKKILICSAIVALFVALAYGFVPQLLQGKIINQSDISGFVGMSHEMTEWNKANPDNPTAWTGAMFGGMPTAAISAPSTGDWTRPLYDLLMIFKRPASYFFISMLGAFLLLLAFGAGPIIAAGAAVAITFCSYNIQIIQVGHNTKMQALAFLPWVLAAVVFTYRKALEKEKWLPLTSLGAALFGLAISMQVKANHPQISYYLAILVLLYALALFISIVKGRKHLLGRFFAASGLLLALGFAGIGTNASKLVPTWEYAKYSMRGGSSDGASKGLDIDYATAWSYGWEELPNLLIPNYNGGASDGAVNPSKSETCRVLRQAGQKNVRETAKHLPLYWGPQPFTAGPMYIGAVTIFLFILGLCCYDGRKEKWWVVTASVLAVLLALGSHFLWFTKLFYNIAPLYNKFRTVSMALIVLQFTLPLLGFLMLDKLVKEGLPWKKVVSAGGIAAGICLFLAVVQSLSGTFSAASDSQMPEVLTDALQADRRALMWSDTWRSILLIAGACTVAAWGAASQEGKRRRLAAALVCTLAIFDVFAVGKRYLGAEDFTSPKNFNSQFAKRPVDEIILRDTDPSYRVLDLTVNVFNDSHPSYWHKNIGGYSPAKLARYQEYIDSHLAGEINEVYKSLSGAATVSEAEQKLPYLEGLASLNCRYIIVGEENAPLRYPYAKGNAWFEGGEGEIEMTAYAPNELKYKYFSATGGLAVFSEVYYPDGWTAVLEDGTALPVQLSSEVLRAIDLPAGEHTLTMSFAPASYVRGAALSRICSILLILLILSSFLTLLSGKCPKAEAGKC